jgi:hypothetical protein|nr:MAG TPA_asm: hypothetical protein [Caudoviricetes sp.]
MATEAQLKAGYKYDKAHTKQIHLKLNKRTDEDVIERLLGTGNVQGYIKGLIRADIERGAQ